MMNERTLYFKEGELDEFWRVSITRGAISPTYLSLAPLVLRILHRLGDGSDDGRLGLQSRLLRLTEWRACPHCCIGKGPPCYGSNLFYLWGSRRIYSPSGLTDDGVAGNATLSLVGKYR